MALEILPYTADRIEAVRAFNMRLESHGFSADHEQFPETPHPGWLPGLQLFLAADGESVHGGYILRRQQFSLNGQEVTAAHYRLPLSEGVIDRAYSMLGLRMVRDALARESRLYAMGMGGWDKPLPQMLKRLGWQISSVPFYFKVVHPHPFLRNIRALRTSFPRRLALDAAAFTGAGWAGMKALGISRRLPVQKVDLAPDFAGWADRIWQQARAQYPLLAVRDARTLDELYPASNPRFLRVRTPHGWALLLDTKMRDHKQFGDMRVGTLVDCLAPPASAASVVRAAAGLLEQRGVDLIVSNQSHGAWSKALFEAGFRTGPSNFLVALSPALAKAAEFHFNRGDGDGPIHL
uniref:Uncharacterized protein n=1 Tax=Solibacter usitatus (strain Ellin6076) TaxID=234267 RepID=Q01NR4_SOLUE